MESQSEIAFDMEQGASHGPPRSYEEATLRPCLPGLPRASRFLAADTEKTTTIFKSFHETSMRNLLFLEARVAAFEDLQADLDREDTKLYSGELEIAEVAASWEQFALLASIDPDKRGIRIPEYALKTWQEQRTKWSPIKEEKPTKPSGVVAGEAQGPEASQIAEASSTQRCKFPDNISKKTGETSRIDKSKEADMNREEQQQSTLGVYKEANLGRATQTRRDLSINNVQVGQAENAFNPK